MTRNVYIILNYKTYLMTETLIDELLSEGIGEDRIVVVDNASPNNAAEYLKARYTEVACVDVVCSEKNGGFAYGNNVGLRFAKRYDPKYVTVINNDVHFSTAVIDKLISRYEALDDAGMIAPKQLDENGHEVIFQELRVPDFWFDVRSYLFFLRNKRHKYLENCGVDGVQRVGIVPGAFMLTDYAWFESVGFFDEFTFLFGEERYLGLKAQKTGRTNYIILNESYRHCTNSTIRFKFSNDERERLIFSNRLDYIDRCEHYRWLKKKF